MLEVSKDEVQKFVLHQSGLRTNETISDSKDVINRIHNVQIDTISVVARAQELTIFNRFPNYKEKDVWKYQKEKEIFEFWSHAICLLPIEEYPFYIWRMDYQKEHKSKFWQHWEKEKKSVIKKVYSYIRKNGPTKSADFKQKEKRETSGWWDWKDEKIALEMLFRTGKLLIAFRENFQRYYDISENVIPSNISTEKIANDELPNYLVNIVFSSLGLASVDEIIHYTGKSFSHTIWNNNRKKIESYLLEQVEDGQLLEVKIDDLEKKYFMLDSGVSEFNSIQKYDYRNLPVKFLTPFDNIMRERNYTKELWDFEYFIEAYTPSNKRVFGYYTLPILDKHKFVGRTDMKVHRKEKILELKRLFFEDDLEFDDEFLTRFVNGLNLFKDFHKCKEITIKHCNKSKLFNQIRNEIKLNE